MTTVGIRDLARRASAIVRGVRETGEPAIVTDRGRPVGVLYPIDEGLQRAARELAKELRMNLS